MTQRQWSNIVKEKVEAKNRKRLYDDCHKTENGIKVAKTKTACLPNNLLADTYTRKPCNPSVYKTGNKNNNYSKIWYVAMWA